MYITTLDFLTGSVSPPPNTFLRVNRLLAGRSAPGYSIRTDSGAAGLSWSFLLAAVVIMCSSEQESALLRFTELGIWEKSRYTSR